jgi:iron(III) transport system substrate-binding protein
MNRRNLVAGAALALAALSLAGCGLQQPSGGETEGGGGDGPTGSGTVTIYSPRPSAITDHIIEDFEEQSGYTVQLVTLGAAEVADRIRAEGANTQADVWWGGTPSLFDAAAAEDLIEPWPDDILDRVPEEFHGQDDKWVAEMQQLQLIAYNSDMIDEADLPADWENLTDSEYADQILIRDVAASGTMRGVYSALIYQHFAEDGAPDAGYDYLRALDANTKDYAANPEDLYLRLERQEAALTIWNHQDILAQAAEGAAFAIHMPESGAPINLDGIAKVNGAPNPEGAEAFADYIFSDETQTWLAENAFQIPTIEIEAEPEWLSEIEIVEFPVDRAVIAEHEQEWIDYWLENIKNQG